MIYQYLLNVVDTDNTNAYDKNNNHIFIRMSYLFQHNYLQGQLQPIWNQISVFMYSQESFSRYNNGRKIHLKYCWFQVVVTHSHSL